jgi:Uma2 family endonuclease
MTRGTPNHNRIALNFSAALNLAVKQQPYETFVADQKLWIPKKRINTYPHVMVVEGELLLQEGRRDTITNPLMIAEVLSESTRAYDKDKKFVAYRTIPSFQEYVLIDQYIVHVEQYHKTDGKSWMFTEYDNLNETLSLNSLPFQIMLADIYNKVKFE